MKPQWIPRICDSLGDALFEAMQINDDGRQIVWEIERDDGLRLNRQAVVELVRQRKQDWFANPPQKSP
jgi:hypothetical protein